MREFRPDHSEVNAHPSLRDNLAPGSYTVTVSAKGFGAATREVRLGDASGAVDFRLSVSAVGETVTVEAETARVELERTPGGVAVVAGRDLTQTRAYNMRENNNVLPFPGAPFTIPSYRSAPNTRHRGVELALDATLRKGLLTAGDAISARTAYTFSRFRYIDDPTYFNNHLPGAPRHIVRSELRYDHPLLLSASHSVIRI
jgi:hypothetical protein